MSRFLGRESARVRVKCGARMVQRVYKGRRGWRFLGILTFGIAKRRKWSMSIIFEYDYIEQNARRGTPGLLILETRC